MLVKGFRVSGSGCRALGFGFRGQGCRVYGGERIRFMPKLFPEEIRFHVSSSLS